MQVYQMRATARRNEIANYPLTVAVKGVILRPRAALTAAAWPCRLQVTSAEGLAVTGENLVEHAAPRGSAVRLRRINHADDDFALSYHVGLNVHDQATFFVGSQ
jgi:hypothetical protein